MKYSTRARLLLFCGALAISGGIAAAQTAGTPVLARVELTGTAMPTLPMYTLLRDAAPRDYALVLAPISSLQQSGASYRVVDANATHASE